LLGGRDPIHELFADEFSSGLVFSIFILLAILILCFSFETAPDSTWGWEENKAKAETDLTPNIENLSKYMP
jgi:hypothetical protein